MASTILKLLPSTIGQILSYDDASHKSLALWLTGNRAMHQLLADGVFYVELVNKYKHALCFLPKYLTHLRSLRHLIIYRTYSGPLYPLYDHARTVSILQDLPSSMESLFLRFRHSTRVFIPEEDSSAPHIDLQAKFPNLLRLHLDHTVWDPSYFSRLPASLSELAVALPLPTQSVIAVSKALPRSLTSLTVYYSGPYDHFTTSFFSHLPRLTSLIIHLGEGEAFDLENLALTELPRTLTSMRVSQLLPPPHGTLNFVGPPPIHLHATLKVRGWSPSYGVAAPPFLDRLDIISLQDKKPGSLLSGISTHLHILELPPSLLLKPEVIRILPRHLVSLKAGFDVLSDLEAGDFAPTLRYLSVSSSVDYPFSPLRVCSLLPPLLSFETHPKAYLPAPVVSMLPRSITVLNISVAEGHDFQLPPGLNTLHLFGKSVSHFGKPSSRDSSKMKRCKAKWKHDDRIPIPTGWRLLDPIPLGELPLARVTYLRLVGFTVPTSHLLHLPPHLTDLEIDYVTTDVGFSPSSNEALDRARYLLKLAGEENHDFRLLGQRPQVTMFDLLPRTLKILRFQMTDELPGIALSRLPPKLVFLGLHPVKPIKIEDLVHLPASRLKMMIIYLNIASATNISLPSQLRFLHVRTEGSACLDVNDAHRFPVLEIRKGLLEKCGDDFDDAVAARNALIEGAVDALDYEALARLLSDGATPP